MDTVLISISASAALVLGILLGFIIGMNTKLRQGGDRKQTAELQKQLQKSETQRASLQARQEADQQHHREQIELLKDARNQLLSEFKIAAASAMDQKQKQFTEANSRGIAQLLKPLQEQIHQFSGQIQSSRERDAQERGVLKKELEQLMELNQHMSLEAQKLTSALKGSNKAMGTWGELILQRVLESSGLEMGREYEIQKEYSNPHGQKFKPDAVIFLPGKRNIIIDSKVSLISYERAFHSITEDERKAHVTMHLQSIKKHLKDLSSKDYQDLEGLHTPDFVLMFVPIEGALAAAVQEEQELFEYAINRKILLVSPSTLYLSLRIVEQMWRGDRQHKNAREIATRAGALYDKFEGFIQDMQKIGDKLRDAQGAWEDGTKKLASGKGNILKRVRDLKKLGAETKKEIGEFEFDDEFIS